GRARGDAPRARGVARLPPGPRGPRAADEAHPAARVRARRLDRARHAHLGADRPRATGSRLVTVATEIDQVVEELRQADKLLLTTHENPDGDALGSLLATHEILTQLGNDSVLCMSAD